VERCLGKSNRWIRLTKDPVPDRSYAVKELIEDNVYEFRVCAVNKVGEGPVGPSSEPVTAKDPWGTSNAFASAQKQWLYQGFPTWVSSPLEGVRRKSRGCQTRLRKVTEKFEFGAPQRLSQL